MKRVILFGCSGMLGNYVYYSLCDSYYIHCFGRKDFDILSKEWSYLEDRIFNLLDKGDYVINCAGIIPQRKIKDLSHYDIVNTEFPIQLANICEKGSFKFIHISTNCVFSGTRGEYSETSDPDSIEEYGKSKAAGEPSNSMVIRTSIIGEELGASKAGLLEWVLSNARKKVIPGYTDHLWNGVSCLTLSRYIKQIIDKDTYVWGLKHIASSETVSKADLCCIICRVYGLDDANVCPILSGYSKNCTLKGTVIISETIESQIREQMNFGMWARADSRSLFAPARAHLGIQYYLIHNLDPIRKKRMIKEFLKSEIDNNFVKWILYPNKDTIEQYPGIYQSKNFMSNGYIACTYKHYLALGDIIERNHPLAVIMEDNMEYQRSVPLALSQWLLDLSEEDWSILFDSSILDYQESIIRDNLTVYPKSNEITRQCHGGSRGAAFYLIKQETARALHDNFLPFSEAIDHWYNILFRKLSIKSFWTHPPNARIAQHDSCRWSS